MFVNQYRKNLKKIGKEQRHTYTGTFERFGKKKGYMGIEHTVLLKNVKNSAGQIVTDHLWFNKTKGFADADLKEGDIVQFEARVAEYEKGYFGRKEEIFVEEGTDYKLSYPSKIKVIGHNPDTADV